MRIEEAAEQRASDLLDVIMENLLNQDYDHAMRDEAARLKSDEQAIAYISARPFDAAVAASISDFEAVSSGTTQIFTMLLD